MSNTTESILDSCEKETKEGSIPPPDPIIHNSNSGNWFEDDSEMPDLSNFVNEQTEHELDKIFSNRYTVNDPLYAAVTKGFPDPVIVYPWNKRPKRNWDHTGGNHRGIWRRVKRGGNWRNEGGTEDWGDHATKKQKSQTGWDGWNNFGVEGSSTKKNDCDPWHFVSYSGRKDS